ncbi:MAG: chemotaxis protein CheW [Rhodoferax sp.]|nr:chemotaxis protein CheW [Rhodoferax sp.]
MSAVATLQAAADQPGNAGGTAGSAVSLLRLAVGTQTLAVSIADVREILQVGRLTPMPRTPAFVRGVINLRGAVVPVIDLGARLGLGAADLGRRSCIVIVEVAQADPADPPLVAGLLVDAVFEVLQREPAAVEPAPELGTTVPHRFLHGITRAEGQLVGVLALPVLLAVAELADAIEQHPIH